MKGLSHTKSAPIYHDAEKRRRRFDEVIRASRVAPPIHVTVDALATTLVAGDSSPDLLIASPASEVCVTQTLQGISVEPAGIKNPLGANVPSVEEARTSPISVLLTCRAQTPPRDKKYQARLYATAVAAYGAYYEIERSSALWKEFIEVANAVKATKHPIRLKDRSKALLLVMRFVFGWSHDYDRAYKLARGLELCRLRKLQPQDMLPELERKGIEKLYQAAREQLPYSGKTAQEKADMRMSYDPAVADDFLADLDGGSKRKSLVANHTSPDLDGGSNGKPATARPIMNYQDAVTDDFFADLDDGSDGKSPTEPPILSGSELKRAGERILCIELEVEQLAMILKSPEHQRFSILFDCAGILRDGWRRYVAAEVTKVGSKHWDR
ncbi:hypothetical protein LB565_20200 [Mesorhizobium sp. CA14]|uniref:hypothetical protein n=1 Tax=Mesorhizobium sp. CA14 TaxID=2876642 RepID=UPI001CCB21C2|nr:hypothetical protein [Mesorhizobium sp. CA14]MBZ9850306.1 hypothetical protein [Mesorhizobium sp. CA14]